MPDLTGSTNRAIGLLRVFASVTSVSPHGPCRANFAVLSKMICSQLNPIEDAAGTVLLY